MRRIHLFQPNVSHADLFRVARQIRQHVAETIQRFLVARVILQEQLLKAMGKKAEARAQRSCGIHLRLHPSIAEAAHHAPIVVRNAAGGVGTMAGIQVFYHHVHFLTAALHCHDPVPRKRRPHVQRIAFRVRAGLDVPQPQTADQLQPFRRTHPALGRETVIDAQIYFRIHVSSPPYFYCIRSL